jgi:hypothetical protein
MDRATLHTVAAAPLRYLLSLPSAPAPPTGWPVLCFLHGYDEAAPLDLKVGVRKHGPLREGSAPGAAEQFVVVAPQLPMAGDLWYRFGGDVQQIVRHVQALHAGDPERTYLTGFSFGGNGVFDLALEQRDFWAALWAVDPTRVPPEDPARPVWLSFGEIARHRKPQFVQRLRLHPAGSEPDGERLYLDLGEDHVGSATSAYRDPSIYRWLLANRLGGAG